jgi:hypothetical protein
MAIRARTSTKMVPRPHNKPLFVRGSSNHHSVLPVPVAQISRLAEVSGVPEDQKVLNDDVAEIVRER